MDAGSRRINDILNGSRLLEIPFFQRAYVWERPLLERFLESMKEASHPKHSYFFGTLILKQSSTSSTQGIGDIRTIIDGQQRITTFLLFLKILCIRSKSPIEFDRLSNVRGNLSVRHNFMDRECFEEIMCQSNLTKVDYNSRLAEAYNFFFENVDTESYDLFNILDNIIFVGIDLLPQENEQVIFDTINSLGVSLTTGELLKNYLFSASTIDKYNSIWKPVFENDEETIEYWNKENTLGRLKRINLETFLYAYLHIKINDQKLNLSASDKLKFRSADDLFNQYKYYLELAGIDLIEFSKDLTDYAQIYRKYITSDVLNEEIPQEYGIERLNVIIFGLDTTTLIPYLLYVLRNQKDESEINKIAEILESYLMRRLICKSGTKNYSDLFSQSLINPRFLSDSVLNEYLKSKNKDESLSIPTNQELLQAFHDNVLIDLRSKGVLYMIESKIRDKKYSTALRSFNGYSLEHLMPKKWNADNWPIEDPSMVEARNQKLKTLGNLALLTQNLNSSISNNNWKIKLNGKDDKKKGLKAFASGLETMNTVLQQTEWNESKIDKRADWLYHKAITIWPFEEAEDAGDLNISDTVKEEDIILTPGDKNNRLFYIKSIGCKAEGELTYNGKIIIKGGSLLRNGVTKSYESKEKRDLFLKENCVLTHNGYLLKKDSIDLSPSTASGFVMGRSSNGREEWKDKNGIKLENYLNLK